MPEEVRGGREGMVGDRPWVPNVILRGTGVRVSISVVSCLISQVVGAHGNGYLRNGLNIQKRIEYLYRSNDPFSVSIQSSSKLISDRSTSERSFKRNH